MKLLSFFNSSASYRVRIALELKGISFETCPVNIRTGEHRQDDYARVNPSASVPTLVDGDVSVGQSLAIIGWLDTHYPEPRMIPANSELRMRVMELSYLIACDIHPVNNLRILKYLQDELKVTPAQKNAWYRHWIGEGMAGVERLLQRAHDRYGGPWCFGEAPSLADCCLVPQMANARRFGCDLALYPRANAIDAHAQLHPAFNRAAPAHQPDYTAQ